MEWMTFALALIGVLGTIGGAWLGHWATLRTEQKRQEHADRVRFHDKRYEICTEFIWLATEVTLHGLDRQIRKDEILRLGRAVTAVGFLGTPDLREITAKIWNLIAPELKRQKPGGAPARKIFVDTLGELMHEFAQEFRRLTGAE